MENVRGNVSLDHLKRTIDRAGFALMEIIPDAFNERVLVRLLEGWGSVARERQILYYDDLPAQGGDGARAAILRAELGLTEELKGYPGPARVWGLRKRAMILHVADEHDADTERLIAHLRKSLVPATVSLGIPKGGKANFGIQLAGTRKVHGGYVYEDLAGCITELATHPEGVPLESY